MSPSFRFGRAAAVDTDAAGGRDDDDGAITGVMGGGAVIDPNLPLTAKATNPKVVDDMLRREMERLSLREKLEIDDEIHGFYSRHPAPADDTDEFRRERLEQFRHEIGEVPVFEKQAYLRACSLQAMMLQTTPSAVVVVSSGGTTTLPPTPTTTTLHVLTDDYRLRFLRATLYDARRAAIRYCKWLDVLVEYYGDVALTRPLCCADVEANAGEGPCGLKEGVIQLLPGRDRSGRRVMAFMREVAEILSGPAQVSMVFPMCIDAGGGGGCECFDLPSGAYLVLHMRVVSQLFLPFCRFVSFTPSRSAVSS